MDRILTSHVGSLLRPEAPTAALQAHPELVAQRLTRLAKPIERERVMAGTDCRFAQTANTRRVPVWTQWAKLQALVDGARIASEELWPRRAAA